jgi:hypothetical protein
MALDQLPGPGFDSLLIRLGKGQNIRQGPLPQVSTGLKDYFVHDLGN